MEELEGTDLAALVETLDSMAAAIDKIRSMLPQDAAAEAEAEVEDATQQEEVESMDQDTKKPSTASGDASDQDTKKALAIASIRKQLG